MKIIIACTLKIEPDQRDEALTKAAVLIKMAADEPGCLAYTWGAGASKKTRFMFLKRGIAVNHWPRILRLLPFMAYPSI